MADDPEKNETEGNKRQSRFQSVVDQVSNDAAQSDTDRANEASPGGDSTEPTRDGNDVDDPNESEGTDTDTSRAEKRSSTDMWEWIGDDRDTAEAGRVWNSKPPQETPDENDPQPPTGEPTEAPDSKTADDTNAAGSNGDEQERKSESKSDSTSSESEGTERAATDRVTDDSPASGTDTGEPAVSTGTVSGQSTESAETDEAGGEPTEYEDDTTAAMGSVDDIRRPEANDKQTNREGDTHRAEPDQRTDTPRSESGDPGDTNIEAADSQADSSEQTSRVWNRDDPTTKPSSESTKTDPLTRDATAVDTGKTDSTADTDGYQPSEGLDIDPGASALIQCGSRDDRKHAVCHDLLGLEAAGAGRNVLLIRYQKIHPARLEQVVDSAERTKLITIGYSQQIPESIRSRVETASIHNPNDITRLGILVSGTVDSWKSSEQETVLCYDSINVLLEYKDTQSTFRFLHIFLGTLGESDVTAHFHVDPLAGDPQKINTLKPLFDRVVTIDSMGIETE